MIRPNDKVLMRYANDCEHVIRLNDKVWMRYANDWVGIVIAIEDGLALVMQIPKLLSVWIDLEFLELAPGNEEEMVA